MNILAIDPGNEQSAFVLWNGTEIISFGKYTNEDLLSIIHGLCSQYSPDYFAVEKVASYGMAVGQTTFDTWVWAGRFLQHFIHLSPISNNAEEVFRKDVKLHHCGHTRAKDSNIIQALKDRFEPGLKPRLRPKKLLKGITADVWQAFALATYFYDKVNKI